MNGMDSSYTRWFRHGEDVNVDVVEHRIDVHDRGDGGNVGEDYGVGCGENVGEDGSAIHLWNLIGDLHAATVEGRKDAENEDAATNPHDTESFFKIVMREAKRQLYPGCSKFSRFSFVVNLLHMKSL
jgi:hypothetical protein